MPDSIASLSIWYAAAAAAFAVLCLLALLAGGLLRNHFVVLAMAGLVWAGFGAATASAGVGYRLDSVGFAIEFGFMLAWFALLYRLLRGPYRQSMPETVRRGLYLFWMLALSAAALVLWLVWVGGRGARLTTYFSIIMLGISLLCLALTAQLKKDAPIEDSRSLAALVVGAGLLCGAQVVLFGAVLLSWSAPDPVHDLRAVAAMATAVLLIFTLRRRPQWSLAIFVSPQARAYAPRLLAVLVILIVLLAATPLLRSMPLSVAHPLALGLIAVVGAPVVMLLFSETMSARLRVFVSKHFLPFRYDYREEWLRLIDTLAAPDQTLPLPERTIKALAQIVNSPAGLLWLLDSKGESFGCETGWNTTFLGDEPVPADDPALLFMQQRQWILDTAELNRDPALYEGLTRPEWLDPLPEALLVVPLISGKLMIGFIVLFQSSSAFRLTFEEIDLLRTSGRQVAAHLAQYQADRELSEAKQFEAFSRFTAFVMHDLKNLIAQQSLMVKNASKHKANPQFFEDAMATIENSVGRMNKLLRQLERGASSGPSQRVSLSAALRKAVETSENRVPEPAWSAADSELYAEIDPERFSMIVAHLIRNAQEATSAEGSVGITLARRDGRAVIDIVDDGCGMDKDFIRNRLFRPFDSTKGSQGMGIGAYQARTFVTEAGGTLEVESSVGKGTRVTISLPLVP